MKQFKAGDRVRRIKCDCDLIKIGEIGVVESVNARTDSLYLKGYGNASFDSDNFELVIEERSTTFENARVGYSVYDWLYGYGVIVEIRSDSYYPITVRHGVELISYTFDGKANKALNRTLYWSKPEFVIPTEPARMPDIPVDTVVKVWDNTAKSEVYYRNFKTFSSDGKVICYADGCSSTKYSSATRAWDNYEILGERK